MSEYVVIRSLSLTAPELNKASETERAFLLAAGHLQNEVGILNKLFAWSIPRDSSSSYDDVVQSSQAIMLGKMLAGKLAEGWTLFEAIFFGSQLSRQLTLPEKATEALSGLKTYFGRKNLVRLIRNDFAFHYSPEKIGAQWEAQAKEPGFEVLVGDTTGNTFHQAAEHAANAAMLEAIVPGDRKRAIESFFSEVQAIGAQFSTLVDGVIHAILERHFGKLDQINTGERKLGPLQPFSKTFVPFFTDMP